MSKGKFDIYCHIKRNYQKEKYLFFITDSNLRRNITGIRCASNILPVNWLRKYQIKRENRYCNLCKTDEIGNEIHTILYCQNNVIQKYRRDFFELIYKRSPQLQRLNIEDQFYYIIKCIEKEVTLYFSLFLHKIFKLIKSQRRDVT